MTDDRDKLISQTFALGDVVDNIEHITFTMQADALSSIAGSPLTAADLAAMPQPWIAALHAAALQVDSDRLRQLTQTIPTQHTRLSAALETLVNTFDYDKILELSQPPATPS